MYGFSFSYGAKPMFCIIFQEEALPKTEINMLILILNSFVNNPAHDIHDAQKTGMCALWKCGLHMTAEKGFWDRLPETAKEEYPAMPLTYDTANIPICDKLTECPLSLEGFNYLTTMMERKEHITCVDLQNHQITFQNMFWTPDPNKPWNGQDLSGNIITANLTGKVILLDHGGADVKISFNELNDLLEALSSQLPVSFSPSNEDMEQSIPMIW